MAKLERLLEITARTRILDVGGTAANWALLKVRPQVTIGQSSARHGAGGSRPAPGFSPTDASSRFAINPSNVVFSNSVIEHVGEPLRHQQFAARSPAVGVRYFVQTPIAAVSGGASSAYALDSLSPKVLAAGDWSGGSRSGMDRAAAARPAESFWTLPARLSGCWMAGPCAVCFPMRG